MRHLRPLNPAYKAEEFEFYLTDLKAKALVVEAGSTSPAVAVAEKLGVRVVTLTPDTQQGAGAFRLAAEGAGSTATPDSAEADDIALVLHTSGTTSRPKIVPLSQRNVCVSAGNIAETLVFTAADRGLNIMPLFHIHGLMAGILAPLSAGGSVFCTPGFNALRFFAQMDEAKPTWYTAVPTMHQAILTRAAGNRDIIKRHPLRFVRSSSSSLPPQVIAELEATFGAPVIESYGMTEASHQMASNPLNGARKPGSVGRAAGPDIAIMGDDGKLLPPGKTGEIVIRGRQRHQGLREQSEGQCRRLHERLVPHRRPGRDGRRSAMSASLAVSRRSSIAAARRFRRARSTRCSWITRRCCRSWCSPCRTTSSARSRPPPSCCATARRRPRRSCAIFARRGSPPSRCRARSSSSIEIPLGATGKLQRIGLAEKLGLA